MSRPLGIQSFNAVGRQQTPPQVAVPVTVGPFSTGGGIGYEPDSTVTAVYVNTSGTSTLTITLPGTSTVPAGRRFIVQDIAGNAATKNIAVNSGGGTIHGSTTIDADYGYIEYQSNGTDWYVCNETAAAGGPTVTGSDTQVAVIDSSGNLVGTAGFVFTGSVLNIVVSGKTLSFDPTGFTSDDVGMSLICNGYQFFGVNAASTPAITVIGDAGDSWNSNVCEVDDGAGISFLGNRYGAKFTVNNAASKTTSNVKHEASGNITVMTNGQGLHQQSPNGHYWRQDVSDLGVATWTDIGTSPP